MTKQLQGIMYYLSTGIRSALTIFWAILAFFLILTLMIHFLVEGTVIAFNLSFPIYIFAGVIGFITVKGVLPYLIKVGANRINLLYWGCDFFHRIINIRIQLLQIFYFQRLQLYLDLITEAMFG